MTDEFLRWRFSDIAQMPTELVGQIGGVTRGHCQALTCNVYNVLSDCRGNLGKQ